jgi:hypothetical protein
LKGDSELVEVGEIVQPFRPNSRTRAVEPSMSDGASVHNYNAAWPLADLVISRRIVLEVVHRQERKRIRQPVNALEFCEELSGAGSPTMAVSATKSPRWGTETASN